MAEELGSVFNKDPYDDILCKWSMRRILESYSSVIERIERDRAFLCAINGIDYGKSSRKKEKRDGPDIAKLRMLRAMGAKGIKI